FPVEATLAGDTRYNDLLPNSISEEYIAEVKAFFSGYKDKLSAIDKNTLNENDQMSYDILLWECNIGIEGSSFKDHLMPINQFWSMPLLIGQLASGESFQPFKTVKDYDNWLARLDAYIVWCDTAIANMRKGIREGYVIPKSLTAKVIPQMADLDHGPVTEHLFYGP